MGKEWRKFHEDCLYCGGELWVLTDCEKLDHFYEGDEIECVDCDARAFVGVDDTRDDGFAFAAWPGE